MWPTAPWAAIDSWKSSSRATGIRTSSGPTQAMSSSEDAAGSASDPESDDISRPELSVADLGAPLPRQSQRSNDERQGQRAKGRTSAVAGAASSRSQRRSARADTTTRRRRSPALDDELTTSRHKQASLAASLRVANDAYLRAQRHSDGAAIDTEQPTASVDVRAFAVGMSSSMSMSSSRWGVVGRQPTALSVALKQAGLRLKRASEGIDMAEKAVGEIASFHSYHKQVTSFVLVHPAEGGPPP